MDLAQGSPADNFGAASASASAGAGPRRRAALRSHPAFAPGLGVWGAGLGAVIVMVLPAAASEAFAGVVPGDLAPPAARFALAGCAALLLGLVAYGAGRVLARQGRAAAPRAAAGSDKLRPIDPARELGSESLDAPLPAGLFADDDWRDDLGDDSDQDDADWLPEPQSEAELAQEAATELSSARAAPSDEHAPPRAFDLAGFAALEGRYAVWVEEPAVLAPAPTDHAPEPEPELEPEPEPEPEFEPNPDPALVSAIARLRAVPATELSLCEMVERFAAALQDYRTALEAREGEDESREAREAVLHEALGALGRITGEGLAAQDEAPTPDGPARRAQLWAEANALHDQRGAA